MDQNGDEPALAARIIKHRNASLPRSQAAVKALQRARREQPHVLEALGALTKGIHDTASITLRPCAESHGWPETSGLRPASTTVSGRSTWLYVGRGETPSIVRLRELLRLSASLLPRSMESKPQRCLQKPGQNRKGTERPIIDGTCNSATGCPAPYRMGSRSAGCLGPLSPSPSGPQQVPLEQNLFSPPGPAGGTGCACKCEVRTRTQQIKQC